MLQGDDLGEGEGEEEEEEEAEEEAEVVILFYYSPIYREYKGTRKGRVREGFENWMLKYAISGYQGTFFTAVFSYLIV